MHISVTSRRVAWAVLVCAAMIFFYWFQADRAGGTGADALDPQTVAQVAALHTPTATPDDPHKPQLTTAPVAALAPAASAEICKELDVQLNARRAVFQAPTLAWLQATLPGDWRTDELYLLMDTVDKVFSSKIRCIFSQSCQEAAGPWRDAADDLLQTRASAGDNEARMELATRALNLAWPADENRRTLKAPQELRKAITYLSAAARTGHVESFLLLLETLKRAALEWPKDSEARRQAMAEYGAWREVAQKHGSAELLMTAQLTEMNEDKEINSEIQSARGQHPEALAFVLILQKAERELPGVYGLHDSTRKKLQALLRDHQQVLDALDAACKPFQTKDS